MMASMMNSEVGSTAVAPGRDSSTRRNTSSSLCGLDLFANVSSRVLSCVCDEAVASAATPARCYECSKYVFVAPVVVLELEFIDVERQIGLGNLVERADDTALDEGSETFNGLCERHLQRID